MTIFRESDKRIVKTTPAQLELVRSFATDELEENESITLVQYVCAAHLELDTPESNYSII